MLTVFFHQLSLIFEILREVTELFRILRTLCIENSEHITNQESIIRSAGIWIFSFFTADKSVFNRYTFCSILNILFMSLPCSRQTLFTFGNLRKNSLLCFCVVCFHLLN